MSRYSAYLPYTNEQEVNSRGRPWVCNGPTHRCLSLSRSGAGALLSETGPSHLQAPHAQGQRPCVQPVAVEGAVPGPGGPYTAATCVCGSACAHACRDSWEFSLTVSMLGSSEQESQSHPYCVRGEGEERTAPLPPLVNTALLLCPGLPSPGDQLFPRVSEAFPITLAEL